MHTIIRHPDGTLSVPRPAPRHDDIDAPDPRLVGAVAVPNDAPVTFLLHPGEGGYDEALADPDASGEALRHILVGGVHAVEDFAAETAEAEGGPVLTAHEATKIIGEVLAELDA